MLIRPYEPSDLPYLYEICLRTGDAGQDASAACCHPRLLGDYYAAPYPDFDASTCLTMVDEAGPCGYVVGALDTRQFVGWFNERWLPQLRIRYCDLRAPEGARDKWLLGRLTQDVELPEYVDTYPAHLHIDLLPRAQGQGWGRQLFGAWITLATARLAVGVHLDVNVKNARAMRFYARMGMLRRDRGPGVAVFTLRL